MPKIIFLSKKIIVLLCRSSLLLTLLIFFVMDKTTFFDQFVNRHLGVSAEDKKTALSTIGVNSMEQLINQTIPDDIKLNSPLNLPQPLTEFEYLRELHEIASTNKVYRSYIGMGYYGTITPSVILKNILENPGWYTQYTPYQAEISQGRLEALLNFQTMISDLTGLPLANASLLDEGTAIAEAMSMVFHLKNKKRKNNPATGILVDTNVFDQSVEVVKTRANPLGANVIVDDWENFVFTEDIFAVVLQYPGKDGVVEDLTGLVKRANEAGIFVIVAADILSLALLTPPGEWGADVVVGSTQRFGIPMGFGGPHAAYFATKEAYKRQMPGRIIGVSKDTRGNIAYRMALQTREQHIKREKATSNICTAQALLAIMAGMYAVYHGAEGLTAIARRIHGYTQIVDKNLRQLGYTLKHSDFFDTITVVADKRLQQKIKYLAKNYRLNFFFTEDTVQISIDETTLAENIDILLSLFGEIAGKEVDFDFSEKNGYDIPPHLLRKSKFLTHPVFNDYHTETKMMRYIKRLENKDVSLVHSMIPLGSCTMKLNAATEMIPITWREFAHIHPFAPADQVHGYMEIIKELGDYLTEITGLSACTFQPNSGAQGEFTGLMAIRAYHAHRGEDYRTVTLIPSSAHGTNPASAVMAGTKVVVVKCTDSGDIDVEDLRQKAEQYRDTLSGLMITYPSTHGVFETKIIEMCDIIHQNGGLVYMDGANMNAQVGLTSPGKIGADICHLNLHKTFAIPHGGGGPGVGPVLANEKLAPFLPGHVFVPTGGDQAITAVSSAPYGSAGILVIAHAYISMMGAEGLTEATKTAILNANYIRVRLEKDFKIVYTGARGFCAHEVIVDLRPFKSVVSADDVAKRLMDYGFHAPTLSFPVPGTIMIEPTESESIDELDRFCEALLQIKVEIEEIATGKYDVEDNVLSNAPHTAAMVTGDDWIHPYSREKAAWPLPFLREGYKFWTPVSRIDNGYGDRNLFCTCVPVEEYQ